MVCTPLIASVARRRPVERPSRDWPLPPELRRENVTVASFVPWHEQPTVLPAGEDPPYLFWRKLQAWRRWQDAVTEWGAANGLDRDALRAEGLWPKQAPPFRR